MRYLVASFVVLFVLASIALGARELIVRSSGDAAAAPSAAAPDPASAMPAHSRHGAAAGEAAGRDADDSVRERGDEDGPATRTRASGSGRTGTAPDGPATARPASPGGGEPGAGTATPPTAAPERTGGEPEPPGAAPAGAGAAQEEARSALRRAAAAYENVESLQADFSMRIENPLLRSTTTSRGTLYQRRPDRFLMRFSEPEGDVIVSDGNHIWVFYPSANPRQVIRTRGGATGAGGMDLQAQFVGDPLRRFEPELLGREEVGGRAADVILLRPTQPMGYRSLKLWVDRQDGLARRFEITEDNGNVRRIDLGGLRTNHQLGDELFRFTVPEGVRVVDQG